MKHIIQKTALTLAVTGALVSCSGESGGGGGGGTAGIGGSGFVSKGSITSFGSVFVNGVEFETTSATFDVEGVSGSQDDLAIGMIVGVNGTINADGVTGNATSISFDDQLQGPVSALSLPDADGITRTMNVLGVNVILDSGSTVFDISGNSGIPANTLFNFIAIADDNNVEISGFIDTTGNLHATRVELKNITFDASSIVEVKGTIKGLSNTTFNLDLLTVDAATANIEGLPNGLADDELVEVKGTFNVATTTITAGKVEAVDNTVGDTDEFEIEGIVTNYLSVSSFKLNGMSIDASNATRQPATLILKDDVRLEAEGMIVNGVLIASEIELRGGNAKVSADVTSVNISASTFEVSPVTGQPAITITITTSTQLEDDVNKIEPFSIGDLVKGTDFVEIRGFADINGGIIATEVQVRNSDKVVVQGIIQSGASAGTVKVYGVEFGIVDPSETEFKNASNVGIDQTDFFNTVIFDTTLVKVADKVIVNGIADSIEIETP